MVKAPLHNPFAMAEKSGHLPMSIDFGAYNTPWRKTKCGIITITVAVLCVALTIAIVTSVYVLRAKAAGRKIECVGTLQCPWIELDLGPTANGSILCDSGRGQYWFGDCRSCYYCDATKEVARADNVYKCVPEGQPCVPP